MTSTTMTRCPVCAGKVAEEEKVVRAQPLGHDVKYVERHFVCASCSSTFVGDEHAKANDEAWTRAYGRALATVTGADLRTMREASKLTRPELEAILGLGTNTLARWEDGTRAMPDYIATMLRLIALDPTSLRKLAKLVRAGHVVRAKVPAGINPFSKEKDFPQVRAAKPMVLRDVKGQKFGRGHVATEKPRARVATKAR